MNLSRHAPAFYAGVIDLPYGEFIMYLVIKNFGKMVAKNVKLEFEPRLKNSSGEDINDTPLIKKGIDSIPPGYEIKTFFDSTMQYFKNDNPLSYVAKVTYMGGIQDKIWTTQQTLDLSVYKGLISTHKKGINELVKEIEKIESHNEKISRALEEISDNLASGIWLKNAEFMVVNFQSEPTAWKSIILAKLSEFKLLWSSLYNRDHNKLIDPFFTEFRTKIGIIKNHILLLTSNHPSNVSSELIDQLVSVTVKLYELGQQRFYADGGKSIEKFDANGNEIENIIDGLIEQIKSNYNVASDNSN